MSFGQHQNTGLRVIYSYAYAKLTLEGTKKIRGRADDQIPLGNRDRIDQFRINLDPHTLDVLLICYNAPVVTWHPDDTITIKTDSWNTQATAYFIGAVTGVRASRFNGHMCVAVQSGQYTVPKTGLKLVKETHGGWEPVNPEQHMVHKLNRKAYNNVRSRYAEFEKYYMGMAKLRDGGTISKEELGLNKDAGVNLNPLSSAFLETTLQLRCLMQDTDPDTRTKSWLQAFYMLATQAGRPTFSNSSFSGFVIRPPLMLGVFQRYLVGIHRGEVLVDTVVPRGKVTKDRYAAFFNNEWDTYHENLT